MSIGISAEHRELASGLTRWAAGLEGAAAVRAAEDEPAATFADTWKSVTEMGVAVIAVPEALGGGGGTLLDQAVAIEACAQAGVPGPLLGPAVVAHVLATDEAGQAVAAEIADGAVVGLALVAGQVWDAPAASRVLVSGREDRWYVVPADAVAITPEIGLDLGRRFGRLGDVDPATVAGAVRVQVSTAVVRRTAVTLAAAEAAGIARWSLATAVEHAKTREQFGRLIGAFQAVKHLCAEMLETAEAVTAAAWDAAQAAGAGDEQWGFATDVAAEVALDGAVANAQACIQVLGGIGFTWEHDAHLYLRRALALRALLGGGDAAALALADNAASGVRRAVEVDHEGRDA